MKIKFEKHDIWIGLFWKSNIDPITSIRTIKWYLCIIPMFPIIWETRVSNFKK